MNKQIKKILTDLYALDPSLQKHEPELVQLLEQLLVSRPDTQFDRQFAKRLRRQLTTQVQPSNEQGGGIITIFNYMTQSLNVRYLSYAGVGIAAIALVAVVWYGSTGPAPRNVAMGPSITNVGARAFGSLENNNGGQGERMAYPAGLGAGGGGGMAVNSVAQEGDAMVEKLADGDAEARLSIMPNPDAHNYTFAYDGDLALAEGSLPVLRRVKSTAAAKAIVSRFTDIDLNGLNLTSFSDLALQNISFVEDHDLGYMININLEEGVLSISENWQKWRDPAMENCTTEECWQAQRLNESDVPSDETLLAMAEAFIDRYGIDMSMYGEPVVNKDWRNGWETRPVMDRWIPEVMDVVYPLQIDGQTVYEEAGTVFGVHVNINIRRNKVSGLWNYTTHNYERSLYPAETDEARIKAIVERGGRFMPWWPEANEQVEVPLGDPEQVWLKIWRYNGGASDEFIVPALRFPITDKPENSYVWQDYITVPLISEMLSEYENRGGDGPVIMPVEPEPFIEGGGGEPLPVDEPVDESDAPTDDAATSGPAVESSEAATSRMRIEE